MPINQYFGKDMKYLLRMNGVQKTHSKKAQKNAQRNLGTRYYVVYNKL